MSFQPRKKPSWLRLLTVLLLAGVGFIGSFGGLIFGRQWEDLSSEARLYLFLHNCPPDEVRFCSFMATNPVRVSGSRLISKPEAQPAAVARPG